MYVHWLLVALIVPATVAAQSAASGQPGTRLPATAPINAAPDSSRALTPVARAMLRAGPGAQVLATLDSGARLQVLAHDRGWTRVRVEGWVKDEDLQPADSASYPSLSAADLRADPQGTRGKTVRWRVQVIALQTADPLRRDLAPNEPYLLAKGPGTEDALLYLAVPPSLLATARALDPLSTVTVIARVRVGRSAASGVPILDIERIAQR